MDNEKISAEPNGVKIPQILSFVDENGTDNMKQDVENNYRQIKVDIVRVVESEMDCIKIDPSLSGLVQQIKNRMCKNAG